MVASSAAAATRPQEQQLYRHSQRAIRTQRHVGSLRYSSFKVLEIPTTTLGACQVVLAASSLPVSTTEPSIGMLRRDYGN